MLWLWLSFPASLTILSLCIPQRDPHNTRRDRDRRPLWLLIKPTTNNKSKNKPFLYSSVCPSPIFSLCNKSVYMPALCILIEVKAEDVERCLFTHTHLDDPISPVVAIYTHEKNRIQLGLIRYWGDGIRRSHKAWSSTMWHCRDQDTYVDHTVKNCDLMYLFTTILNACA